MYGVDADYIAQSHCSVEVIQMDQIQVHPPAVRGPTQ